jgi:hypothetical protein
LPTIVRAILVVVLAAGCFGGPNATLRHEDSGETLQGVGWQVVGAHVTASSTSPGGHEPRFAIDDDYTTSWCATGHNGTGA